jgi:pimeloyl-ACP methyl ester carboxylesterase
VYFPTATPLAAYVIAPGLHFAGPDDPRLDRFCRVIAAAGFVVVAPFLASYVSLRIVPSAIVDLESVVLATHARFAELGRPAIFSISFGSWPAFEVAARNHDSVDGVITFGGYAEFESVARFCIDGVMHDERGAHQMVCDPLNRPALFLNIAHHLETEATVELGRAWTELCHRTWGNMELKLPGRLDPFIDAIEASLPPAHRALFRVGAAGLDQSGELVEAALERGRAEFACVSPRIALAQIRCPVVICHGLEDDVIPWGEATKLHRALGHAPVRLHLTGLYAHTGAGPLKLTAVAREATTLLAIASAIANGGRLRDAIR